MVSNLAAELGWIFARWDVNAQGFEDNAGLPYIDVLESGEKVAKMAAAEYLPTFANKPTLLEIGELPTAPPNVQNQIRLIVDGMFMGRAVSPLCMMVATGNPPEAEYTTGNQLDAAIEDRLDPYIVVPKPTELLSIWSKIMSPTIFRFLDANQTLIESISPRHWMMVSEKVENLVSCRAEPGEIIQDIRTSFVDFTNILPLLQTFLITGNKEELRIILGREIIVASEEELDGYEKKIERWSKEDLRGLIGASATDLTRTIGNMSEDDVGKFENLGRNILRFIEILTKNNCNDMARALMDNCYANEVRTVVIPQLKSSKLMSDMAKRYRELKLEFAETSE